MKLVTCKDFVDENLKCSQCGLPETDIVMGHCGKDWQGFEYASVDLETTGLDPESSLILQFGIVLDDLKTPIEYLPKLELLVLQEDAIYLGDPFALYMNRELLNQISKIHESLRKNNAIVCSQWCFEDELAETVSRFLARYGWKPKQKVTFAGKNFANFDNNFLERVTGFFDTIPKRHRTIDLGNLYWDPKLDGGILPESKKCMERFGKTDEVAHTALADALMVVEGIRAKY